MSYNYSGLFSLLDRRGMSRTQLGQETGLSSRTIAKFSKGQAVSQKTLEKIAHALDCQISDLVTVETFPLLSRLREEMAYKIPAGIYHELQILLTYNSNHIEGSLLSEEQTRQIFETQTVGLTDAVPVDDIIETINHFRALDFCIEHVEAPLTEDFICDLHRILKSHTRDASLPWFQVGAYKTRPNMVGGQETSAPEDVARDMAKLLKVYHQQKAIDETSIIDFHYRFEKIHPFQDGNGRVGRLILFKECLAHELVPIFIADNKKHFYYRGLQTYDHTPGYLIDTCLDGQDQLKKRLDYFRIPY